MAFRLGLIGAGNHGVRYLRHAARDVAGMVPIALCRRDREQGARLAAELGCRYHPDAQSLIADPEVDGVIVCTPPSSHLELATAVLQAGKPLLLEKPMTATLEQALRLAALDGAGQAPALMLAQTLRWNPVILKAKALWPLLGKVRLIRLAQRLAPTSLPWQHDPAAPAGGSVLITGVHIFDTVRFLTGSEFVEVDSRQAGLLNRAVEDVFLAHGVLADGCWASMEVSKYTRSRACWLEAVGEEGQLWADYLKGGVVLRRGPDEEHYEVSAAVPTLPLVLAAWLRTSREGTPPPVGAADGVASLRVVEGCYRSAASRRAVPLQPESPR